MSTQNICNDKVPLPVIEPVVFCTRLNTDAVQRAKNGSLLILALHAKLFRHELSDLHVEEIPINNLSITK